MILNKSTYDFAVVSLYQKKNQFLLPIYRTLHNSKFEFHNLHWTMGQLLDARKRVIEIKIRNSANVGPWFQPHVVNNSFLSMAVQFMMKIPGLICLRLTPQVFSVHRDPDSINHQGWKF